jgi:TolB-like protein
MVLVAHPQWLAGLAAILTAFAAFPVQAQDTKSRIAVLDFQRTQADEAEAAAAADQLRTELVRLKVFTVLERSQTTAVLGELAFQQEGFTDPSRAMEMGQLLNVEFVVTGRITKLQGAYQVNAQMTAVRTGEIVRRESILHGGDFVSLLATQVPRLAARLAQVESAPAQGEVTPPPTPRPAPQARSSWPMMGMMGTGKADWALVAGGMMLMGAAMMARNSDSANRDAALAVGVAGTALLGYYLISRDVAPAASAPSGDRARNWSFVLLGSQHAGMRAGIGWRW